MDLITLLIVIAGVVSAVRGLVWFLQAIRNGHITSMEVLDLIEYELGIVINLLWMWALLRVWGLASLTLPMAEIALGVTLPPYVLLFITAAFFATTLVLMAKNRPRLALLIGGLGLVGLAMIGAINVSEILSLLENMLFVIAVIDVVELAALLGAAARR